MAKLLGERQHIAERNARLGVAGHRNSARVDHGVIGMAAGNFQLDQRVEGIARGLHAHIFKHGVKAAQLQGSGQRDHLGNTLNAEAVVNIAAGKTPAVQRVNTNAQLVFVGIAKLRDISSNLSLFNKRAANLHGLLQKLFDHSDPSLSIFSCVIAVLRSNKKLSRFARG